MAKKTDSSKLDPCPFCGGEEILLVDGYSDDGCWATCLSCSAIGGHAETHKDAIANWNTRTKTQGEMAKRTRIYYTRDLRPPKDEKGIQYYLRGTEPVYSKGYYNGKYSFESTDTPQNFPELKPGQIMIFEAVEPEKRGKK